MIAELLIPEIVATVTAIVAHIRRHPELATSLAEKLLALLGGATAPANANPEAMRGLAAGIAAARAVAVQAFVRRQAKLAQQSKVVLGDRIELEHMTAAIARELQHDKVPPGVGFVLIAFDYGDRGNMAYAATAARGEVAEMLEELATKLRASAGASGGALS